MDLTVYSESSLEELFHANGSFTFHETDDDLVGLFVRTDDSPDSRLALEEGTIAVLIPDERKTQRVFIGNGSKLGVRLFAGKGKIYIQTFHSSIERHILAHSGYLQYILIDQDEQPLGMLIAPSSFQALSA